MRTLTFRSLRLSRHGSALVLALAMLPCAAAQPTKKLTAVPPVAAGCSRAAQGALLVEPPALYSQRGVLNVAFSYQTMKDAQGRTLYCFLTPSGLQNPTLHLLPGDTLNITVTNNTPVGTPMLKLKVPNCGDVIMTTASANIHYHGTNTSPACGADDVIKTIVNPTQTFGYSLLFPTNEPPGLYWYHPHVHGISENAVMGGATGAIVVDGIEAIQPAVRGLPQRILLLRDQQQYANLKQGPGNCGAIVPLNNVPNRDLSANFVPVNSFPTGVGKSVFFVPGTLRVPASIGEFWRVANTSSDTILDLQLQYNRIPQLFYVVAIDGVPVNSQSGAAPKPIALTNFRLPPASRVEFIVRTPPVNLPATLTTTNINTGQDGDCDPTRPVFNIQAVPQKQSEATHPSTERLIAPTEGRRFHGLESAPVLISRTLHFAEDASQTHFYMTVEPQPDKVFDPNGPPAIVTRQGSVEQWTVLNKTTEAHEFHIHQIHFFVISQNNFAINQQPLAPGIVGQYLDMIEVPAWDGNPTHPFPSVTLLMDFRGPDVGLFVFHCHILGHEDLGMMNIIQITAP
jgi:FtsP/CotA-like multicopper oxidase with cupredoxin domain